VRGEDFLLENPIKLSDILVALARTQSMGEVGQTFAHRLWKDVMKPLWKEKKIPIPKISTGPINPCPLIAAATHAAYE
jgi:hypothetical protein